MPLVIDPWLHVVTQSQWEFTSIPLKLSYQIDNNNNNNNGRRDELSVD